MGRLIDESRVVEILQQTWLSGTIAHRFIDDIKRRIRIEVPTVEAIPKSQYKADMLAMLTELKLEIAELKLDYPIGECEHPTLKIKTTAYQTKTTTEIKQNCVEIIQQKINSLKGEVG